MADDRTFGWRDLLRSVNLRDFLQMVRGELSMIGSLFAQSVRALPRLPFGPLVFVAYALMALLRSVLLAAVFLVFGTAIVIISAVRSLIARQ
jgi:hypothetical protein